MYTIEGLYKEVVDARSKASTIVYPLFIPNLITKITRTIIFVGYLTNTTIREMEQCIHCGLHMLITIIPIITMREIMNIKNEFSYSQIRKDTTLLNVISKRNMYHARATSPNVTRSCRTKIVNTLRMNWLRTATDWLSIYVALDCFSTSYIFFQIKQKYFWKWRNITECTDFHSKYSTVHHYGKYKYSIDNCVKLDLKERLHKGSMRSVFALFIVFSCSFALIIHSDKDYEFQHTKAQFGLDYLNNSVNR